jgi:hypothetical protein
MVLAAARFADKPYLARAQDFSKAFFAIPIKEIAPPTCGEAVYKT